MFRQAPTLRPFVPRAQKIVICLQDGERHTYLNRYYTYYRTQMNKTHTGRMIGSSQFDREASPNRGLVLPVEGVPPLFTATITPLVLVAYYIPGSMIFNRKWTCGYVYVAE